MSPQKISSSSGRPARGPVRGGGALGLTAKVCGTRWAEAGPGLSDVVTCKLRCASRPLPSGVGTMPLTIWIGVPANAISATRQ